MLLHEIHIINYRNLRFLRASFSSGINLIYGSNAQGKTNLLEAVSMLVTARSFRAAPDREMIPWEQEDYEATLIRARISRAAGEERVIMTFNRTVKQVLVNGTPLARLGDLLGRINAVVFTPSDLALVSGPPAGRRRFLDLALSQTSAAYLQHPQRYEAALRQCNALLKSRRHGSIGPELSSRHEQLARHGAVIHRMRAAFIQAVSGVAAESYRNTAGLNEALALEYAPSPAALKSGGDDAAEILAEALAKSADDDARRGFTSAGPHRDDFSFLIDGRDAREFGSQGQQRTCALALKMAELAVMERSTGETPLLLLDDLMSELDESRKRAFLESLDPRIQTLITATEKSLVTDLIPCSRVFRMSAGELAEDTA